MGSQEAHRSGPLKQENKRHKFGRHRTNRAINSSNRGRRDDIKTITKRKDLIGRVDRRNQLKQIRQNKREETQMSKRGLGCDDMPPILVAVLDLNPNNTTNESFYEFLDLVRESDQNCVSNDYKTERNFHISFPRLKTRFEFILIDNKDLNAGLDSVKVADILLLLHSVNETEKHSLLDAIYSHCLPTTVHVIKGLNELSAKKKTDFKKSIQKQIDSKFPDEKLRTVDNTSEASQLMHYLSNCKRRHNAFRSHRTQVLAEKLEFLPNGDNSNEDIGILKIYGYVRNRALDVNSLVHIPGFGDFQMSAIEVFSDPNIMSKNKNKSNDLMDSEVKSELKFVLRTDPTKQQSLDSENMVDPMDGEQTWPTEDEIIAAKEEQKIIKKVPKGTSDYQATWIVDDDDEEGSDDDEESGSEEEDQMEAEEESDEDNVDDGEEDEMETMSVTGSVNEANYDQKMDLSEEQTALQKFKEQRQYELFPDEVDTPNDQMAKTRFARYRGLKSFRTSPWDPKENLPKDYSRIFQFENFARTKKRVFNEDESGAQNGWYVCVHVSNVPKRVYQSFADNKKPLLLYGLLPHEHRMSTINLVIKRVASFTEPIKSKEPLIFHVGCRRFKANPLFSAHTNGDKHKLERFLRSDAPVVATVYAPITFPPASVLVYKQFEDGSQQLVATGSLLSCNPDRVVVKRIVLSGHPFKINKKHAVVRYMFFNRDDIMWFRPIELRTKYGRKGHIREPLGTHGHMKCVFDRQLNSQDTVLMNLYKRVFPKWTYDQNLSLPVVNKQNEDIKSNEDMQ